MLRYVVVTTDSHCLFQSLLPPKDNYFGLGATKKQKDLTLKDFWKSYNIRDTVKNITATWDDVKHTNMNDVWKQLCPHLGIKFDLCRKLPYDASQERISFVSQGLPDTLKGLNPLNLAHIVTYTVCAKY